MWSTACPLRWTNFAFSQQKPSTSPNQSSFSAGTNFGLSNQICIARCECQCLCFRAFLFRPSHLSPRSTLVRTSDSTIAGRDRLRDSRDRRASMPRRQHIRRIGAFALVFGRDGLISQWDGGIQQSRLKQSLHQHIGEVYWNSFTTNRTSTMQQSTAEEASSGWKFVKIPTTPDHAVGNDGQTNQQTSTDPHPHHEWCKQQ